MEPVQLRVSGGFISYPQCLFDAVVYLGHRFLKGDGMGRLQKRSEVSQLGVEREIKIVRFKSRRGERPQDEQGGWGCQQEQLKQSLYEAKPAHVGEAL